MGNEQCTTGLLQGQRGTLLAAKIELGWERQHRKQLSTLPV